MERDGYEADRLRLCVYNLATGEKKYVTESFDSGVEDFVWSDNKDVMIYFIGVWHATINLYAVNWKGELKQMTNYQADFGSLHLMNNGKQLLMERHDHTAPADLYKSQRRHRLSSSLSRTSTFSTSWQSLLLRSAG